MIEEVTVKKLMKNSICFQVSCLIFLVALLGGITQGIMFGTNSCGWTQTTRYSCSYFFSSKSMECMTTTSIYCCTYTFYQCGDDNCIIKPYSYITDNHYQPCYGHLIAMSVLFGISFFDLIFVIFKVITFSRRAAEQNLTNAMYLQARNYRPPQLLVYTPQSRNRRQYAINSEQNQMEGGLTK